MRRGYAPWARRNFRLSALVIVLAPLTLGADRPPGLGDVRELRHFTYPNYTRVVVELTRRLELEADPTVHLPANAAAGMPKP